MADYSLFLYLLYLALSLLVGVVATSTFIWMMNAWRTPDSLEADGRKDNGQPARYSFSLIVPAREWAAFIRRAADERMHHVVARTIDADAKERADVGGAALVGSTIKCRTG